MARRAQVEDDSSDDEFPAVGAILQQKGKTQPVEVKEDANLRPATTSTSAPTLSRTPSATIRRRKLGQFTGNTLLQTWAQNAGARKADDETTIENEEPRGPRVKLRARKAQPIIEITPKEEEEDDDFLSAKEEITFVEEATVHEDEDDFSEFHKPEDSDFEDGGDTDTETFFDSLPPQRVFAKERKATPPVEEVSGSGTQTLFGDIPGHEARPRKELPRKGSVRGQEAGKEGRSRRKKDPTPGVAKKALDHDLAKTFSRLNIDKIDNSQQKTKPAKSQTNTKPKPETPPFTPPKPRKDGLVSPKKIPRIPTTPHHPASDMFWSQEFVDDWNEQHSPKKILFPDAGKSPVKAASPKKPPTKTAAAREAKKAFEKDKHATAEKFLQELDTVITQGELSRLAASTGGIKLNWTNKLNTTAGRANWKRETVRTRAADGTTVAVSQRHHASIELAEKVIDDADRLLNVVAHEFCHLANFMISGVTTNPHGKEFKAWAARCSRAFGDRGIQVTTKHSYDIDFKYVWECTECGSAFKRHSKSINPERHRCGCCKGPLVQTKPVPRATAGKTSEYQKFMKEHMRVLKEENPKSPQKEIMKLVADRWSRKSKTQGKAPAQGPAKLDDIVDGLVDLTLES